LDENRYTRYERGEVEPNLANICRICSVLGIGPNDLFGYDEAPSEPMPATRDPPQLDGNAKGKPASSQAWRIASAIASLRSERSGHVTSPGHDDPLTPLRATAEIYGRLLTQDPGHVVAQILGDAELDELGPERKAELVALIDAFMGDGAMPRTA
jgi:transcriptional regulator with XRE-family HTH domain